MFSERHEDRPGGRIKDSLFSYKANYHSYIAYFDTCSTTNKKKSITFKYYFTRGLDLLKYPVKLFPELCLSYLPLQHCELFMSLSTL